MAEPIRELANRIRRVERSVRSRMGKWESEVEAFNLVLLSATHGLACAKLATSSASFLPSAHLTARAAMEAGAKAMWLLEPEDPYEREARWLAHLDSEASIRDRLEKVASSASGNADAVRAFASAVRDRFPAGTPTLKQLPKFDAMLRAIGSPEKYAAYAFLSQTTHGTHHATGVFRQHLGSEKTFGEFATASDWWMPLSVQWWFLAAPVMKLAERCRMAELSTPEELSLRFSAAQNALALVT